MSKKKCFLKDHEAQNGYQIDNEFVCDECFYEHETVEQVKQAIAEKQK